MGTINCLVNTNTLKFTSISEDTSGSTFARFTVPAFEISGGGIFTLALTVPQSSFLFSTSAPVDFGSSGQPSWITIAANPTAEALTLVAESSTAGISELTIPNAAMEGESITITLQSNGGSGGPNGTIAAYVGDDQTVMIGPLPAGATATGNNVEFGLHDQGPNTLTLSPGTTTVQGVVWNPSQPSYITVNPVSGQITLTVTNTGSETLTSMFSIQTSGGLVDPTIVTNPDEHGP